MKRFIDILKTKDQSRFRATVGMLGKGEKKLRIGKFFLKPGLYSLHLAGTGNVNRVELCLYIQCKHLEVILDFEPYIARVLSRLKHGY